MSARRLVAALTLASLLAGCAADTWAGARLRDVSDILDVRYGTGLGLGVQVDATMFLGTGLGGSGIDSSRVWYGRHAVDVGHAVFVGLGIGSAFGAGGSCFDDNAAEGWFDIFGFNLLAYSRDDWSGDEGWFAESLHGPPGIDSFRFGGTLFLPGVHGGLHLNVGEVIDLVVGLAGFDPAGDDGTAKFPPSPVSPQGG